MWPVSCPVAMDLPQALMDDLKLQLHMLIRGVDCCLKATIVLPDIKSDNVLIDRTLSSS